MAPQSRLEIRAVDGVEFVMALKTIELLLEPISGSPRWWRFVPGM
jgi:hypothetical protein